MCTKYHKTLDVHQVLCTVLSIHQSLNALLCPNMDRQLALNDTYITTLIMQNQFYFTWETLWKRTRPDRSFKDVKMTDFRWSSRKAEVPL